MRKKLFEDKFVGYHTFGLEVDNACISINQENYDRFIKAVLYTTQGTSVLGGAPSYNAKIIGGSKEINLLQYIDKIKVDDGEWFTPTDDFFNMGYAGQHTVYYKLKNETTIPQEMFLRCNDITNITIPSCVTTIGDSSFETRGNLDKIIFKGITPPSMGSLGDITSADNVTVFAPDESVSAYAEILKCSVRPISTIK